MTIEKTWITKAGYQGTVKIMPQGHRCGYVTLPDGHPCSGKDYNDLAIRVHGYLTYGDGATFGFDCGHYGDSSDINLMSDEFKLSYRIWEDPLGEIRSLDFCIEQCESMATQFKELENADRRKSLKKTKCSSNLCMPTSAEGIPGKSLKGETK